MRQIVAGILSLGLVTFLAHPSAADAAEPSIVAHAHACLRGFLWRHPDADGSFQIARRQPSGWAVQPIDPLLATCLQATPLLFGESDHAAEPVVRLRVDVPVRNVAPRTWAELSVNQETQLAVDSKATPGIGILLQPVIRDAIQRTAQQCWPPLVSQIGIEQLPNRLRATLRRATGERTAVLEFDAGEGPLTQCIRNKLADRIPRRLPTFAVHREAPAWRVEVNLTATGGPDAFGDADVLGQAAEQLAKCWLPKQRAARKRLNIVFFGEDGVDVVLGAKIDAAGKAADWRPKAFDACGRDVARTLAFEPAAARSFAAVLRGVRDEAFFLKREAGVFGEQADEYWNWRWPPPHVTLQFPLARSALLPMAAVDVLRGQGQCLAQYIVPGEKAPQQWTLTAQSNGTRKSVMVTASPDTDAAHECLIEPLEKRPELFVATPANVPLGQVVHLAVTDGAATRPAKSAFRAAARLQLAVNFSPLEGPEVGEGVKAGIAQSFARRAGSLKSCYEEAMRERPDPPSQLQIAFTVGVGGIVKVENIDRAQSDLDRCVASKLERIRGLPDLPVATRFTQEIRFTLVPTPPTE